MRLSFYVASRVYAACHMYFCKRLNLTAKKILFVDDEQRWTATYVEELQACGYDVLLKTSVDKALKFFEEHCNHIALLILDLMMPYGSSFTAGETQMGLRTGVSFYERIRQQMPELHVIILTNVADETVEDRFRREEHCTFLEKPETLPHELAEAVGAVMREMDA
jgi:two-component system cell cycle sensor histidine kinase/response regulator CckA